MTLTDIPYKWRGNDPSTGMDCFTLASHAQVKHGRSPLPDHEWVYEIYDNDSFPPQLMLELLRDSFGGGTLQKAPLNLLAIQAETVILGTLFQGESWEVLHFGQAKSVMTPLKVLYRRCKVLGMWNPSN